MSQLVKRALFHIPDMDMGGAQVSALRLIKGLADRDWQITLVVTWGDGRLESEVDPRVKLIRLYPKETLIGPTVKHSDLRGILTALPKMLRYHGARLVGKLRIVPFYFKHYEVAATLLQNTSTRFIRHVVKANTRFHWIHTDLSQVKTNHKIAEAIRTAVAEIDYYICVSEVVLNSLVNVVPETRNKAHIIYNILDNDSIYQKVSQGEDPYPERRAGVLRIVTVCRLHESSKGLRRMARVSRQLIERGHNFQWFIVGDGPDKKILEQAIIENNCASHLIPLGQLQNPFPAYAHADIVAMLSHYEGLNGVVNEAKIVGKPVLATSVSGIKEQIIDGRNGLITENNEESILINFERLLTDSTLREKITNRYLPAELMCDDSKFDKLEALMIGRVS